MRGITTVSQPICVTGLKFSLRLTIRELSRFIAAMASHEAFFIPGMIGDYVSIHVVKFLNVP